MEKKSFCITCGVKIDFNPKNPYCAICNGSCSASNRFSPTENIDSYCHSCGEVSYITKSSPFCEDCLKKNRK